MNHNEQTIKQVIGKTLKAIRIKQGLSQEDLAGKCEVDRSYISMIEVGRNEPSVSKIFELCDGLNIKPSSFFHLIEIEYDKLRS
ncbi:Helix-turn-helix domain-containing protein [Paenibacillus sp. 1_12]|uniref:helix-turn-helix domain-containing protein n=1 Tax=Paenibacillus sp. 1_12 TaxID=1566278 RepID=UPI0008DF7E98|nr:helix-turn-helix transcriptional regulator [Paenibacillus sp. 1_12]SFL20811.1 Helix-turn-helix domain-containing protein [Paenibacillus sp. 1_12]